MGKDKFYNADDGGNVEEFQKFKSHKKGKNNLHKKIKPREYANKGSKLKKFF